MAKGGKIVPAIEELRQQLRNNPEFANWFQQSKATDPEGSPLRVFHGTNRLDRLEKGLDPKRATSGPMPYFTADPEIASKYATGKSDNSFESEGYQDWFGYKPKGARSEQSLDSLWWHMTPEQRQAFHERMPNIREDDEREHVLHDPEGGMASPGTYEMYLREQKGNGLAAARELWLSSGALFDDEHKFMDVLREAGVPMEGVSYKDIRNGQPGVVPAYLSVQNPLVTSEIPPHVLEALDDAASRQRKPTASYGADPWDKSIRDPDEWMQTLKNDVETGGTLAWTSIPDWVTKTLRKLGYDGVRDTGGKMGGEKHDVWVPFEPTQIKSAVGNKGKYDPTKKDITKARGGVVKFAKGGKVARTAMDELKEYANALAPQRGMFSTLDELVQQAPFENGSMEQWRGYLKPGRMLKREGLEFPLKQEELDYAFEQPLRTTFGSDGRPSLTKQQILEAMRTQRPEFNLGFATDSRGGADTIKQLERLGDINTLTSQDRRLLEEGAKKLGTNRVQAYNPLYGPSKDARLSHQSPDSAYEESITNIKGLNHTSHFDQDTMSWARTSSHNLPSGEKMRLIEEIQSDLHQAAAEKIGSEESQSGRKEVLQATGYWDEYKTLGEQIREIAEQRLQHQRVDVHSDEEREAHKLKFQDFTAQMNALGAKQQELVDQAFEERPRRGYRTPADDERIQELGSQILAVPRSQMTDELSTRNEALAQEKDKLLRRVPDAPFKDPREYAALEMKKQLLNAAHNDEDYLALTRGSDQRERYGGAGEGTEYFYDKLYPSEMAKLAKRYGAEMAEVPLEMSSGIDVRPEIMQHAGVEDYREFMDHVENGGYFDDNDPYGELIWQLTPSGTNDHPTSIRALNASRAFEKARAEGEDTTDELLEFEEALGDLYHEYMEANGGDAKQTKTFPAIKLTPEVRERIKKAGVSLWATGAGAAGLELLGHPDDASAEEVGHTTGGGFAEGGSVSTMDELKDLAKRFGLGFSTQWSGLDPKGKARSAIYTDYDAPHDQWSYNPEAGMDLPPNRAVRPGMVDDLASLPSLAATLATLGHYNGPQFSQDAGKRAQALDEALRTQMDVSPPEGFLQHGAEAAGSMFAQLPVPFEMGPATESAGAARKVLGPIAEWFSPTINPSLKNYAVGTGAGTALTMGIPKVIEKLEELRNSSDPWRLAAAAAKSGELPPELAFQLAQKLDPQGDDMRFRQEVPMHSDDDNKEFADSF